MGDNAKFSFGRAMLVIWGLATIVGIVVAIVSGDASGISFPVLALGVLLLSPAAALSFGHSPGRTPWDAALLVEVVVMDLVAAAILLWPFTAGRAPFLAVAPPAAMLVLTALFVVGAWTSKPKSPTPGIRSKRWTRRVLASQGVAIGAAVLLPTLFGGGGGNPRAPRARSDVANLGKAVARMRTDTGNTSAACLTDITVNLPSQSPPATCSGADGGTLSRCTEATPGYDCWGGPYIPIVTNDPWNHTYSASLDTTTYAVTILSLGPDGVPSTDDITFIQ